MKLGTFIETFIEKNSLIRLLYKVKGGHEIILDSWDDVSMEHRVLDGKGKFRHYIDNEVIEICSILVDGPYSEAINICIEKLEDQPYIEENVDNELQKFESSTI